MKINELYSSFKDANFYHEGCRHKEHLPRIELGHGCQLSQKLHDARCKSHNGRSVAVFLCSRTKFGQMEH